MHIVLLRDCGARLAPYPFATHHGLVLISRDKTRYALLNSERAHRHLAYFPAYLTQGVNGISSTSWREDDPCAPCQRDTLKEAEQPSSVAATRTRGCRNAMISYRAHLFAFGM